MSDAFSKLFREEHRAVRDALFELSEAFDAADGERAGELLTTIARLTGPHFRYEEETMYPLLVEIFGPEYISGLIDDHDAAIANARRLVELAAGDLSEEAIVEAKRLVQEILPHVADCDGLSIMVEKLTEEQVEAIFEKREKTLTANLDLLTWDATVRTRPTLAA